jgi:hypothetical protein
LLEIDDVIKVCILLTSLDNGLDSLVNVVVNVLASNDGSDGVSVGGVSDHTLVLKLSGLTCETGLDLSLVAVVKLTVLNGDEVVCVLLREDLTVGNGLDGGVVVVLVNLFVNGSQDLLVLGLVDCLVENSGSDTLVDSGVMVTSLGPVARISK